MIYMAGDNNLSVDMAYALEQIKGVAGDGPDSPNLFVYYDGNSPSIPTLYCDFSDPERLKYVRSFTVPEKLYDVPSRQNENAADRKSMLNFINWCLNDVEVVAPNGEITYGRRANRYAFIISGHSLGFQDIGLFKDETTGKTMKMQDLYYTLLQITATQAELNNDAKRKKLDDEEKKRETTLLLGQKFDILGFDACVMGMLEVGYQFSEVAKTMIASEGSVPSAGWTYAKILGNLARCKGDSNAIGEQFVRDFIKSQDAFTIGGSAVDMAAWDLSRFGDNGKLSKAFDELSFVLLACFDDPQSRIYRHMERVILQVHWKCQSYMYDQNIDLGDFCELLDRECDFLIDDLGGGEDTLVLEDLQKACRAVLDELNTAVILSGFSGGDYQYSNGVSVFFPWSQQGYEVSKKNYEGLWFVKDIGTAKKFTWAGFLKKYLYEVTLRKTELPEDVVSVGTKFRYYSGLPIDDLSYLEESFGIEATLADAEDTKLVGREGTKLVGREGTKLAGREGTKLVGREGTKLVGREGTKLVGREGTKLAGREGTKLVGREGTKLAGREGTKLVGREGTKLAGGGASRFFDNFQMFKNVESRWDISGFTKKPADSEAAAESADATHG